MTIDEIFVNAVESWRKNGGVGTMLCPPPLNDKVPILLVLQRLYNKSPSCLTIIIVEKFNQRMELIEFLTHQESEENNAEFKKLLDNKNIRIFTSDFIRTGNWHTAGFLCILYNTDGYPMHLRLYFTRCTFRLAIFNRLVENNEDRLCLARDCPTLDEFKQKEIDELRTSTPVEEMWIGVTIPKDTETDKLLEYYNKEITTTLNIFGDFENIKCARIGNPVLNQSATEYCNVIAHENGWNSHLDMNIELNRMIDEVYNPKNLADRAHSCYEMIRLRSQLLSDFDGKLEEIYKICKENENAKILIINKRGEFATKVSNYLNNMFDDVVCGEYHDKIENRVLKNPDGTPVLVKSGVNKGKPRVVAAKYQMTQNENLFNSDDIRILSTSNSPNKELNIKVDIIIITSPICEDIKSYLYRLSHLFINGDKLKLYTIYCKSTLEHQRLLSKEVSDNHVIVNKFENMDISKNNFDFIIAD